MAELYTMQRYLQYDDLKKNELEHFDNWASTFGETITAIDIDVIKKYHRKNKPIIKKIA